MTSTPRWTVAIVVPCFNEREALPQLLEKIERLDAAFPEEFLVQWCFVDDGSTDGTWAALHEFASERSNCFLVRHETNRGLAAAILTGISQTDAPIVCSIDADCTYDPQELPTMIDRLAGDVALVTASPYHPQGRVDGVARWRLVFSKTASRCYRFLLRNKLHTYTSCFRVYRREAIAQVQLKQCRFAGIAELLWHVDRHGGKIVEYPTALQKRSVGRSKLRLVPVVVEHLQLLGRCAWQRLFYLRRREP